MKLALNGLMTSQDCRREYCKLQNIKKALAQTTDSQKNTESEVKKIILRSAEQNFQFKTHWQHQPSSIEKGKLMIFVS